MERGIVKLKNLIDRLLFRTSLDNFSDDMVEVDRFAACLFYRIDLVLVKDVIQFILLCGRLITIELDRWESELTLLHIVVNLFVEILTHVGLENDWEVVPVPLAFAASLLQRKDKGLEDVKITYRESEDQSVQIVN